MVAYVSLESVEYTVNENAGTVAVAFVKQGDLKHEVTIEYGTNASSAAAGADYGSVGGFVTIPAYESRVVVNIPIVNDNIGEATEVFNVSLINATGGTVLFPRTALVNILDDETPAVPQAEPPLESNFGVTFQPIVSNLSEPISIEFSPTNPSVAIVALKAGVIEAVDVTTGTDLGTLLDISSKVNCTSGDRGLIDIAIHPDFANNPYIYAFYVVDPADTAGETGNAGADGMGNRYAYLSRFTVDTSGGGFAIDPSSEVVLLGGAGQSLADISGGGALNFTEMAYSDLPSSALIPGTDQFKQDYIKVDSLSHSGGAILFGPDGALYVTTGDGTSFDYADPRTIEVQSIDSLSGKVLRIDPLTGQGLPDNPFVTPGADLDANSSKVYQLGLRNPFAATFDANGRLFLSETGWFSYEEINAGGAGANFGWPFYEGGDGGGNVKTPGYSSLTGASAFYQAVENGAITITSAIRAFSHRDGDPGYQVQAIVGASSVYTGKVYGEAFKNNYFFTDVVQGEIFTVDVNDPRKTKYLATLPTGFGPVNFIQGPDGYLYYADLVTGAIGKIVIEGLPGYAYDDAGHSQVLTGTTANDAFVIDDFSSNYTITVTNDRAGIIVNRGGIPDTLYGYESVKFLDKTVTVASIACNTISGTSAGDLIDNMHSVPGQRRTTQFADSVHGNVGNDVIFGHAGDDKIWGDNGNDSLYGGYNNDQLYGGNGNDKLDGGPGNDFLNGEAGFDTLIGGSGDDVFVVSRSGQFDSVIEYLNGGTDTVRVGESYTLPVNVENATIIGNFAANITGNALNNVVFGNGAANVIRGLAGNDTLCGGGGSDRIIGGTGVDYMCGGPGSDTFVFNALNEIGNGVGNRDVIGDFVSGLDRIDLSGIDANSGAGGNQAFSFIGTGAFSGQSGQVNYIVDAGKLLVQGDVNGDKVADFQLVLIGSVSSLQVGDFIL